jgi:ABC-2 type transport system permease protein
MHKFWVVMSQVYKKNARSGSWIFLVLSPLFFLAIAFGIVFYISKTQAPAQVAVVSDVGVVRQALIKQSTVPRRNSLVDCKINPNAVRTKKISFL